MGTGYARWARRICHALLCLAAFATTAANTVRAQVPAAAPSAENPARCCYSVRLLTNEGLKTFGPLLQTLEADGQLAFEPVFNGEAKYPQVVWKDRFGVFIDPFRASGLEAVLCGHNTHICRPGNGFDRMQRAPDGIAATPQGLKCGDALPGYVICLPQLKMTAYRETITRQVDLPSEDLKAIVIGNLLGCERWDKDCEQLVSKLNPSRTAIIDPAVTTYKGPIRLPYKAIRIQLPVQSGQTLAQQTQSAEALFDRFQKAAGLPSKTGVYAVLTDDRPRDDTTSLALGAFADGVALEKRVRTAIAYPYLDATDRAARDKLLPVTVGVWDKYVDADHCAFVDNGASAVRYPDTAMLASLKDAQAFDAFPRAGADCSALRSGLDDLIDHGTAVAGVIIAKDMTDRTGGLQPRATVWGANLGNLIEAPGDPILEFSASAESPPSVINISQDINGGQGSQFDRLLFGDVDGSGNVKNQAAADMVVVIAAGNDGLEVKNIQECHLYLPCLGPRADGLAVITVTASNPDGRDVLRCGDIDGAPAGPCIGANVKKPAVNYGEQFDVMAPGVAFTTLYGNSFGLAAGTSLSSPRVAALASLLVAAASSRLPSGQIIRPHALDVRMRILAAADPAMQPNGHPFAKFGAVNFRRALEFKTNVVEPLTRESTPCDNSPPDCRATRFSVESNMVFKATLGGKPFSLPWTKVVGLQRLPDPDDQDDIVPFHLVYIDPAAPNTVRQADVEVRDATRVNFYTDDGETWKPHVNDLKEYTACTFGPACPSLVH